MKFKFNIIALLKIWFGTTLFLLFGGVGLVLIGLLPISAVVAIIGLLSGGVITGANVIIMSTLGIIYLVVYVPIVIYSAGLIDSGLDTIFGITFGIHKFVKSGAQKIPVVGKLFGLTLET